MLVIGEGRCLESSDGEWELERLLLEWDKSGHPCLWDKPGSKLDDDVDDDDDELRP